jgi:hypothetical protein
MVTDSTGVLHRINLTALVISYAFFPPDPKKVGQNRKAAADPASGDISVNGDNASFYLADLNRAINPQGELRLLFHGCLAMAAPVLLFRLKREGFSNCRALMMDEGLLLTAIR